MITTEHGAQWINNRYRRPCTFLGLSTDVEKPSENIANGSCFIEMDTGKLYFYDLENSAWLEWGT